MQYRRFEMSHTPTWPSKPADSSRSTLPLRAVARHVTVFWWPVSVIVDPESAFHSRMVPSSLPVTRKSTSSEWTMHEISEASSRSVCTEGWVEEG